MCPAAISCCGSPLALGLAGEVPVPNFGDLSRTISVSPGDVVDALEGGYYPIAGVVALFAFILWRIW